MNEVEKLAKELRVLIGISAWLLIVISGAVLIRFVFGLGMDDSDASAWNRSGLKLHTDHLTGCQYFQAPNGGLTPRLDATGGHICITKGKP